MTLDYDLEVKIKEISDRENCTVDIFLSKLIDDYLDREFDLKLIKEAEEHRAEHGAKFYTGEEIAKMHNIDLD